MNLDPKHLLAPLIALAVAAAIVLQTSGALRESGAWTIRQRHTRPAPDPFDRFERQIALRATEGSPAALRDPFTYGRATTPERRVPARPKAPPPPPTPILTGILADNDPRAFIRYRDHNYTVKTGDLFADLKVVSITGDQVVLDRNGERLTLLRPTKGD